MRATKRGTHPNSLANLRPAWTKGQSGNPGGPQIRRPLTDRYFTLCETILPEPLRMKITAALVAQFGEGTDVLLPPGSKFADASALRLHLVGVLKGDVNALREIADRCEGRAPNRLDLVGMERQQITIKVVAEEPQTRAERQTEFLYKQLVNLVRTGDEQVATAAAELAAVLKNKGRNVQPA